MVDEIDGAFPRRPHANAAGEDHEIAQLRIEQLAVVSEVGDSVKFILVFLEPCLAKALIDAVLWIGITGAEGIAAGDRGLQRQIDLIGSAEVKAKPSNP